MMREARREWARGYANPNEPRWSDDYLTDIGVGAWHSREELLEGCVISQNPDGSTTYLDPDGREFTPMYRDCSVYVYARTKDVANFPALLPTYSVGSVLAESLGNSLVYCADNLQGYPPYYPETMRNLTAHPTARPDAYQLWQGDMKKHGEALLRWHALDCESEATDEDLEKAEEAIHWVASYLENLWD